MAKNIYSLVLSDEIIAMIDNVAYKKGTSRSTLINNILADYVGYETPEKRIQDIFSLIDGLIEGETRMRLLNQSRDSGFSIVSALNYKYSPRITYQVEFEPNGNYLGELLISYRTSKPELIGAIENFFATWISLEKQYLDYDVEYTVLDGRLKRELYCELKNPTAQELAKIITSYVANLDKQLNMYISDNPLVRNELLRQRFLKLDTKDKI